jgi:hypothetical protein
MFNLIALALILASCGEKKVASNDLPTPQDVGQNVMTQHGTTNHVKWSSSCRWNSTSDSMTLEIIAELEEGWHLYSQVLESDEGPLPTIFTFEASSDYSAENKMAESKCENEYDENFAMNVRFFKTKATFTQIVLRKSSAEFKLSANVNYMVCNDEMCLPPTDVPMAIMVGKK